MAATPSTMAASWPRAVVSCARGDHALCIADDHSTIVLYVDAHMRAFHPLHALLVQQSEDYHQDSHPDLDMAMAMEIDMDLNMAKDAAFLLVLRLHPRVAALLQRVADAARDAPDATRAHLEQYRQRVVERLALQPASSIATASSLASSSAWALRQVPLCAAPIVACRSAALCAFAASESQARGAVEAIATHLRTSCDDDAREAMRGMLVVVEHANGYIGRRFAASSDGLTTVYCVRKQEYRGDRDGADRLQSLDDALEEYASAYREDREIRGTAIEEQGEGNEQAAAGDESMLAIKVHAAFEVCDQSRRISVIDALDPSDRMSALPPACLISSWQGIENVRSLACKPPARCRSLLCFSRAHAKTLARDCESLSSLQFLQHLVNACRSEGTTSIAWSGDRQDEAALRAKLHRFLTDARQGTIVDDSYGGEDNTIQSSISVALEAEQAAERMRYRSDLDLLETLWVYLQRETSSSEDVLLVVQEFVLYLSNTTSLSSASAENTTQLGKLVQARQATLQKQEQQHTDFASAAQVFLQDAQQMLTSVIEIGEWKMKRDVKYCLSQAGFSAHECAEFAAAFPPFGGTDSELISASIAWKAMNHVIEICQLGRDISLPIANLRPMINECVAHYANELPGEDASIPAFLAQLDSFIPDTLRGNIADPIVWDLQMSFGMGYEHRIRICQEAFHCNCATPFNTAHPEQHADPTSMPPLSLDAVTIANLHRDLSEDILQSEDVQQFLTHLDQNRRDVIDMIPLVGMTRYDVVVSSVDSFP